MTEEINEKKKEYVIPDEYKTYSIDSSKFIPILNEFVLIPNISNIIADYSLSWICMDILRCLNNRHCFVHDGRIDMVMNYVEEAEVNRLTNILKSLKHMSDCLYYSLMDLLHSVSFISPDIEEVVVRIDNSLGKFKNIIETSYEGGDGTTARFIHDEIRNDFLPNIINSAKNMIGADTNIDYIEVCYLHGGISKENKAIIEIKLKYH